MALQNSYRVCIIVPPGYTHAACFLEVAYLLKSTFQSLRFSCDIAFNELAPNSTNIILGCHLLAYGSHLKSYRYIPYQLEQLSATEGAYSDNLRAVLGNASAVWDYSSENIAFLKQRGISAVHVPLGYHPNLQQIPHKPIADRDIDVLFYGSLGDRRKKIVDQLRERNGVRVETLFGVYGKERDAIISRSRVILNVHFYAVRIFEAVRISYLLNNGCCVVTEESPVNPYPRVELCSVPYENLVETCTNLLANPAAIQDTARQAFEGFRTYYPMQRFVQKAIDIQQKNQE